MEASPLNPLRARQPNTPHEAHTSSERLSEFKTPSNSTLAQNLPSRPVMDNQNKAGLEASSNNALVLREQNISHKSHTAPDQMPGSNGPPVSTRSQFVLSNGESPGHFTTTPQRDHRRQPQRHQVGDESWKEWQKLTVILSSIPQSWGTWDVYKMLLKKAAAPARIDMSSGDRHGPGNAKIIFRPPPGNASEWMRKGFNVRLPSHQMAHIYCKPERESQQDAIARQRGRFGELEVIGSSLGFGIQQTADTMLVMRDLPSVIPHSTRLVVNMKKQQLDIHFSIHLGAAANRGQLLFCRIPFTEILDIHEERDLNGNSCFTISLQTPPLAFRKTTYVKSTHDLKVGIWDERQTWYRQASIEANPELAHNRRAQLRNEESYIDIGRWLCYRFVCSPESQPVLQQMRVMLAKNNIAIRQQSVQCIVPGTQSLWHWLGSSMESSEEDNDATSLDLISSRTVHLPFAVQYGLEACISQGCLHESRLDASWAQYLLARDFNPHTGDTDPRYPRVTRLLERVLDSKQRFYNPMDIFRLENQVSLVQKHVPHYCNLVRSATVTPTMIYFNSPSVDTSNRIVRKYREYQDRFLRVKFRDEPYKGMIMNFDDITNSELFTRVQRVLKNGIVVGDRRHEFLAFGNSQFREYGAYFFAPTDNLTPDMIRDWMGDFKPIKTVAKFASRMGQCLSTTRPINISVEVERIPDIERNGYCFSDGVGRISPFVLQILTGQMQLPTIPSVIQFRLGGCKGVLVCDPDLKGQVVQIRPSQEKFLAGTKGLEVCRVAKFSTAYLNQQIILVLSALRVPDEVFLVMLRRMLAKLELAMTKDEVAADLLLRNIDQNQSTVELAEMIKDGFMTVQEPFFLCSLRLWRAWSIKYLKEKAKIFVEKGAFVMGVIDETATLKGHENINVPSDETHDEAALPEIFLQVEDKNKGMWKVVTGVCVLARNPSLHPGDSRIVKAVDVPALRHLKDCVVLPSNGDRDIASMCSGGDLDGDDYLVIWDPDLIPQEWNHEPMDYTAPPPAISEGPITVDDIRTFFVTHMKHDNLGRIANTHRYLADRHEKGIKHRHCLELAALHSKAVDFAKTGVPAGFPKNLKVTCWPHWAEKEKNRSYKSKRILGLMYDEVDRVPFEPAWEHAFDDRILKAFKLDNDILSLAREVKTEYDIAIRRLMTQHGVKTEFEIWTTFVMEHNHESRDFKLAEELGEAISALRKQFIDVCYEKAGTTPTDREWVKLKLFVAAMYTVTAHEVAQANEECDSRHLAAGRWVTDRERVSEAMPLMSFPWLFRRELGNIANKRDPNAVLLVQPAYTSNYAPLEKTTPSISTALADPEMYLEPLPIINPDPERKDSLVIISPVADVVPEIKSASPPYSDAATLDLEILDGVLPDSRAFNGSDLMRFGEELKETNGMLVEVEGGEKVEKAEEVEKAETVLEGGKIVAELAVEVKVVEHKAAEHKAAEHKAAEHKAAEHKAVEQKVEKDSKGEESDEGEAVMVEMETKNALDKFGKWFVE
jgi:RNA-dependent RNA polymerase